MKLKHAIGLGLATFALGMGIAVAHHYDELFSKRKTFYGQIDFVECAQTDKLISMGIAKENGGHLTCNIPVNKWEEGTYSQIFKEYEKDRNEAVQDLEKVVGYFDNKMFFMEELEINGKTFKFK